LEHARQRLPVPARASELEELNAKRGGIGATQMVATKMARSASKLRRRNVVPGSHLVVPPFVNDPSHADPQLMRRQLAKASNQEPPVSSAQNVLILGHTHGFRVTTTSQGNANNDSQKQ